VRAARLRANPERRRLWVPVFGVAKTGMTTVGLALALALPARAQAPDEAAVGKVLDAFHAAAAHSDFKGYFDLSRPMASSSAPTRASAGR
jgi:hypothetical protein